MKKNLRMKRVKFNCILLYPEGVEVDLVGDRAEVSMMDSFGH
jgi:hypothetical protein